MKKPLDFVTLGEVLMRLSPANNERFLQGKTFIRHIGGAELNVAAVVAQLGLRAGVISKLPANDMGGYARNRIRSTGVKDDYLVYDEEKDARLGVYYYETAASPRKPRVVYDRSHSSFCKIRVEDFDDSMYSARCFHTSGITLALGEEVREQAVAMMKKFKEHKALISFDVNFRGNLWTGDEARECIEKILPYVDIFFCSESTARLTFKKEGSLEEMMKSFAAEYPISVIAATQRTVHSPRKHSFGSLLYSAKDQKFYCEEPYRDIEIVDRIGSGDAYVGGVLYALLSDEADYLRAVEYGNAVSAAKNTVEGDLSIISLEEADAMIAAHKDSGEQLEMSR